jgi:hypothetical protein
MEQKLLLKEELTAGRELVKAMKEALVDFKKNYLLKIFLNSQKLHVFF